MSTQRKLMVVGLGLLGVLTLGHGARAAHAMAQTNAEIRLWPGDAPGALGTNFVNDVPTLTLYRPDPAKATGAAMVICPGGAYAGRADYEGRGYALWLARQGITCFVLKYRLGTKQYRHPAMMDDVNRAIRWVRYHAAEWNCDPARIGVMGSSAGGHLAATALTHYDAGTAGAADPVDRVSSRPDFGVLCYAVITMGEFTHAGSKKNLLGENPPVELVKLLSNEVQVNRETPPCFIWHTAEDKVVPVQNALLFAEALAGHRVPFSLHIYPHGGHGMGLGVRDYDPDKTDGAALLPWTRDLTDWLKGNKIVAEEGRSVQGVATPAKPPAATILSWPDDTIDTWKGHVRHTITIDGCKAWVVEPKKPLPGNPWTWVMEFPNAFTDRTGVPQLLEKGFFHVHIQVGNTFGCPAAVKHFDALYAAITAKGLAKKGTLIGLSRGGLYAYNWASQNPDKVVCVYGDAPVCDFKSWPGGKGKGKGSPGDWKALIKCYGFKDEAEALAWPKNPVDSLEPLAKAGIPLIHVVGDVDDVVPVAENTAIVEQRYKALGGTITVIHKPAVSHHPHGLDDTKDLVEMILRYTAGGGK